MGFLLTACAVLLLCLLVLFSSLFGLFLALRRAVFDFVEETAEDVASGVRLDRLTVLPASLQALAQTKTSEGIKRFLLKLAVSPRFFGVWLLIAASFGYLISALLLGAAALLCGCPIMAVILATLAAIGLSYGLGRWIFAVWLVRLRQASLDFGKKAGKSMLKRSGLGESEQPSSP